MQKMKSKKGFTLIEMLIVVGIIAVLVAVSIPLVNSSLERARVATDAANERAAKAAALIDYMSGKSVDGIYDAAKGNITSGTAATQGYGKCTSHAKGTHNDMVIAVKVDEKGTVSMGWVEKTATKFPDSDPENLHGIDVTVPEASAGP